MKTIIRALSSYNIFNVALPYVFCIMTDGTYVFRLPVRWNILGQHDKKSCFVSSFLDTDMSE